MAAWLEEIMVTKLNRLVRGLHWTVECINFQREELCTRWKNASLLEHVSGNLYHKIKIKPDI